MHLHGQSEYSSLAKYYRIYFCVRSMFLSDLSPLISFGISKKLKRLLNYVKVRGDGESPFHCTFIDIY